MAGSDFEFATRTLPMDHVVIYMPMLSVWLSIASGST